MNIMRLSIPVMVLLCFMEPSSSFSYGMQTKTSTRTFGTRTNTEIFMQPVKKSYGLTKGLRDTSLSETPEPSTDANNDSVVQDEETVVDSNVEIAIPDIMATIRAAENDAREARMAAASAQTPTDATNTDAITETSAPAVEGELAAGVLDATMNIITSENDARKALLAELMAEKPISDFTPEVLDAIISEPTIAVALPQTNTNTRPPPKPSKSVPTTSKAPPQKTKRGSGALVPINQESVEFTAGFVGAGIGLAIGGPYFALLSAAIANYSTKTDSEVGDAVQTVSRSALELYNYAIELDAKYEVLQTSQSKLREAIDNLKNTSGDNKELIEKLENSLTKTTNRIEEFNAEYDFVGSGLTALEVAGDLVYRAVEKVNDLNDEYGVTQKATDVIRKSVESARKAAVEAGESAKKSLDQL
eukprot:CAMPEP_0194359566 /NCGR_PEP_ID=MMETSP0174-20130528/6818_1 /TAXON_ID=216777 /ORGANISM="Proboscia alata, Strain PI-D3" /LENGTH=417 /DNA_ID=CAMNT_0039130519 /DNA_START=153 /DNA_END=1406 /DNA_ORIENTATION=-